MKNIQYKTLFLITVFSLTIGSVTYSVSEYGLSDRDYLIEMPPEELSQVPVEITGLLTPTSRRKVPMAVTTLTKIDIQRSGARSLDELLDIYVPNLQLIRHSHEPQHLGLRGINSDREDKYLILVNGRVMNEHLHYGAYSERDLPMLTDIHHVDVIRGPGSALHGYGPGAISMVINIVTDTAMTFEGTEMTARLGSIEEFYSGEMKFGKRFDEDSGIFIYGGLSKYLGADTDDAPYVYGFEKDAGQELSGGYSRDQESFLGRTKVKTHIQYTDGGFNLWVRYTRGGMHYDPNNSPNPAVPAKGTGYQQITAYTSYTHEMNAQLGLEYAFSYDSFEIFKHPNMNHREDEYYARFLARWVPHEKHLIAVGTEFSHEEFGLPNRGFPDSEPTYFRFSNGYFPAGHWLTLTPDRQVPRWSTNMYSIFGEYQYRHNDQWTVFLGGRIDDHSFTPVMYSPRAVVVHTPTDKDTLKFMASRAVRTNLASDMKVEKEATGKDSEPEKISVLELRYERRHSKNLWLAGSAYVHDQDVVGWNALGVGTAKTGPLGNLKTFGFEVEAVYRTDKTRITLSHGFTKLHEFTPSENATPLITAHPYGYGHDLANWSNHITKLTAHRDLTEKISVDGSLRVYWGYPGAEDFAAWTISRVPPESTIDRSGYWQQGYTEPFDLSMFLNLGFEYNPANNLKIRVDGYNLLGIFDRELNGRLFGWGENNPAAYQAAAPAIGVSLTYKF